MERRPLMATAKWRVGKKFQPMHYKTTDSWTILGDNMTTRHERAEVLTKAGHMDFTEVEKVLETKTELCTEEMDVQGEDMNLENAK